MKIFILEDDLNRIEQFRRKLIRHNVSYCDDVETAKAILGKDKYDIIFFDHDLGGEQMVDSSEANTGYQLAKWIRSENMKFDQIVIHSCNPIGAANIEREVKGLAPDIIRLPFPILIKTMK